MNTQALFKHLGAYLPLLRRRAKTDSIKDEMTCFSCEYRGRVKNDEYERKIFFPKVLPEAPV